MTENIEKLTKIIEDELGGVRQKSAAASTTNIYPVIKSITLALAVIRDELKAIRDDSRYDPSGPLQ